jgi:hypothetical protein
MLNWGRTTSSTCRKCFGAALGSASVRARRSRWTVRGMAIPNTAMNPNGQVPTIQDDGLMLVGSTRSADISPRHVMASGCIRAIPSSRECRALDGWQLATSGRRWQPCSACDPGQTRAARSGSDRGSTPAGAAWTIIQDELADRPT